MNKFYSSRAFQFFAIVIISSLCVLLDILTKINFSKIELPKNRPEYNAQGVDGRVYNKSGKLVYKLTSNNAWEFPDDVRVFMQELELSVYEDKSDQVKYSVKSDDGWVNYNNLLGFLGKNVVITIFGLGMGKNITIYGDQINLDMNKHYFDSDKPIKAIQEQNTLSSTGFSYDSERQLLTLNSKVKVVYFYNR